MPKITNQHDSTIVFDIGGTYFRSAIAIKNEVKKLQQRMAATIHNTPDTHKKDALVAYLVNTARDYAKHTNSRRVAISLGAALDGRQGTVYGSAPLWGNDNSSFDLLGQLSTDAPEFSWHLVNDVTAGLIHYASHMLARNIRKILLVTISTGIASRVFDTRTQEIVLDEFGLQGEIGHIPITLGFEGQVLELNCDCGAKNHIAAFSSGHGLAALTELLIQHKPLLWKTSKLAMWRQKLLPEDLALKRSLDEGDAFSSTLLHLATRPIADMLHYALTLDPEIDRIVLTGGVAVNLSTHYMRMLKRHFTEQELYLKSRFNPKFFENRLVIADAREANNLMGAAIYATTKNKSPAISKDKSINDKQKIKSFSWVDHRILSNELSGQLSQ